MKTKTSTRDITALENLLQDARNEADKLRGRLKKFEQILLSTRLIMGHELKRPTTAITGYIDMVLELEENISENAERHLTKARSECDLLNELNMIFLELLKTNTEKEALGGTEIDIEKFFDEMIVHLPEELNATERVRFSIPPNSVRFQLNPNAFKIILANVVENALLYSPNSTPVHVEMEQVVDKRHVEERTILKIKVVDRGEGIPKDSLKKIFHPFVRLNEDIYGSGLGLTLVRSLVELHGGNISIQSTANRGTTVFIALPEASPVDLDEMP